MIIYWLYPINFQWKVLILKREKPNRFIANVRIQGEGNEPDSDPVVRCHVKNTGTATVYGMVDGDDCFVFKQVYNKRETLFVT